MNPERRYRMSDLQWDTLLLRCPSLDITDRSIFEATLTILSTALPWQDLSDGKPNCHTVQMRYQRWLKRGEWPEFLEAFLKTLDPLELDTWRDALERAALLRSVVRGRDKRLVLCLPGEG